MDFVASVMINKKMSSLMVECCQELCERAVMSCASHYNFDGEEAVKLLGLCSLKVVEKSVVKSVVKSEKARFPLPFNGEMNDKKCYALRQNNGLYTQCQVVRKDGKRFCKQCDLLGSKSEGVPEYGTIEERMAVGILEYVDPKGRKPVSYRKIMNKYKISEEEVLEEASRLNIKIDSKHFIIPDANVKRGRPVSKDEKPAKEVKGAKGRPKKTKKVVQIDGGDDDDLFASLVADANKEDVLNEAEKEALEAENEALEAEKEAKKQTLEAEKEALEAEKETKKQALEAEKEAKKQALEAEKEAKKQALEAEKEAKKQTLEAEKEAKKQALEAKKQALEAKKQTLEAEKEAKKQTLEEKKQTLEAKKQVTNKKSRPSTPVMEDDDEPDVVKKIEFEGKKYLKSKKTGIIYDYNEYTKNGDQIVIGKWNEVNNKIDLKEIEEEETEDEYDT